MAEIANAYEFQLIADLSGLESGLRQGEQRASQAARSISGSLEQVERSAEGVARSGDRVASASARMRDSMGRFTTAAKLAADAAAAAQNSTSALGSASGQLQGSLARSSTSASALAGSIGRLVTVMGAAGSAMGRFIATLNQGLQANPAQHFNGIAAANNNIAQTAGGAASGIGLIQTAIAALAVHRLIELGTAISQAGIQMNAIQRGLEASSGSAEKGGKEFAFIREESNRLGLSLADVAKQYTQMSAAAQKTGLEGLGVREVFTGVVTAMTALGKSSTDTNGALLAVQQMMSKGKVTAEELNGQLGERLPGAYRIFMEASGKGREEFKKMMEDGELLAEEILPKVASKLVEMYGGAAAKAAGELPANINRLKTAAMELATEIANGGLNQALNNAAISLRGFLKAQDGAQIGKALGDSINFLTQALERVPRDFENLGIGVAIIRDLIKEFTNWGETISGTATLFSLISEAAANVVSAVAEYFSSGFNTAVQSAVAGAQMIGIAFSALPSVLGEIAINAANALIKGIQDGVNAAIKLVNDFIVQVNAALAMIPGNLVPALNKINEVSFAPIENNFKGATDSMMSDMRKVGEKAGDTDYLGGIGKAGAEAVKNVTERFKDYRDNLDQNRREQARFNEVLRRSAEAKNKVGRATNTATKANNDDAGGAKKAASAYENLIQRTKDRIEELQLEAQYASKTATEVIKLKLAHDLERAAKKDGKTVTAEMRAEWDRLGDQLAEATQQLERVRLAQKQLKEGFDFATDAWKSFAEEILTGTGGINGALKALGKTFLSSSLEALFSGKGGLAALTGLAPTTKDGQGGIFALLTQLPKAVQTGAEKGSQAGTIDGVVSGLGSFATSGGLLGGIDGKQLAGGLTAIAGLAGAYGQGMAAGSFGQAMGGGAISGAMAGASLATALGMAGSFALPGIGAILGIGLGYLGQQQARKQAREERERQAQENYKNAQPDIEKFRSQARGDPQNTLRQAIKDAETTARKLADVAYLAGKSAEANAIWADGQTYAARITDEFRDSFAGMIAAMNSGLGPNSPFAQAKQNVMDFGKELQGFIDNAALAYGDSAEQVQQAKSAAVEYALSVLDGAKSLSTVQSRLQEIEGTAAALQKVLVDLGATAEDAARAIETRTRAALEKLRVSFEEDLQRQTREASGLGYINEISDLLKKVSQLRLDASALKVDPAGVTAYLQAAAQEIIDSAQLTGSAFAELVAMFPELNGLVGEFTGALKGAAREADIAARKLAYADRLFAALNDTSTLEGQLAAFERQAQRQREEELRRGGEALYELEAALAAERYNIIKAWNERIIEEQKRALEEARSWFEGQVKRIKEYLDGLKAGPESPLSPGARLTEAEKQFREMLAKAKTGDRDSLAGITGSAERWREAAKAMYASGSGYQAVYQQIMTLLGDLPTQVSAEQYIVDAINGSKTALISTTEAMQAAILAGLKLDTPPLIAAALSGYFNKLDTTMDGLLTPEEFLAGLGPLASKAQQEAALAVFRSMDANGDGLIDAIEAMHGALLTAVQANNAQAFAGALNANFSKLDTSINGLLDYGELLAGLGPLATKEQQEAARAIFQSIDADGDGQISKLEALNASSTGTRSNTASIAAQSTQLVALAEISSNTQQTLSWTYSVWAMLERVRANLAANNYAYGIQGYAGGGWVSGPGTGISDSVRARLSNGEFVMPASQAQMYARELESMRAGSWSPSDGGRVGYSPSVSDSGAWREVASEIRRARDEERQEMETLQDLLSQLIQSNSAGHEHTAKTVQEQTTTLRKSSGTRGGMPPVGRSTNDQVR